MKIKIAHITQCLGGVKTYIENVFNYADQNETEYIIIAPENEDFRNFCEKRSITYYPVKIHRSISPVTDMLAFIKITNILRNEKPDIIHTHSAKGGFLGRLAAKFTDAKVIYAPHGFSYLSFKGLKRTLFYSLEVMARKWTDVLLSVSHSEASRAIYEVGFESKKVETIVNAVQVAEQLPFKNYNSGHRIGMIGRLTYQKNPLLFLEIASMLLKKNPNLEFSILGAGLCDHLSDDIDIYIKANNLESKVKILPWGNNDTSKEFLMNTDIFVMTSVFEGLPFSLLEAMSMGIPSVVSKVDGNTDVIQNNENGYSCLTAAEFKNKLELLISNEALRRQFGQAGYRYVKEQHEIQSKTGTLEALYARLYYSDGLVNMKQGVISEEENALSSRLSLGIA